MTAGAWAVAWKASSLVRANVSNSEPDTAEPIHTHGLDLYASFDAPLCRAGTAVLRLSMNEAL